jgi:hypothetical protein
MFAIDFDLKKVVVSIARFFSPHIQTSSVDKTDDDFLFQVLYIPPTAAGVRREIFLRRTIRATISFAKRGSADIYFAENLFPSFCV